MTGSERPWRRPLIEFATIFAGVTLSLLADDWRDHRNDGRHEEAALHLIRADLVRDTAELRFALRPAIGHERSTYWLVSRWDDASAPPDSIQIALTRFLIYNSYQFQSAAYRGLREGDRLNLISNDSLRTQIVDYFEESQVNVDQFLVALLQARERVIDGMAPFVRWPLPRDRDTAWPTSGPLRLLAPWDTIRADNRLANQISAMGALASLAKSLGNEALARNEALRTAIDSELEGR